MINFDAADNIEGARSICDGLIVKLNEAGLTTKKISEEDRRLIARNMTCIFLPICFLLI